YALEAEAAPGRLRALDDEGGVVRIELIGVRPYPAVRGLLENERESVVEFRPRAEPDVLAGPHIDVGLEDVRQPAAHLGIDAVGCHDQVAIVIGNEVVDLSLEEKFHIELLRPLLQDVE